ncbi:MAG: PucR family transcriptional regulator [Coriobacteriales bacterium]
MKSSSTPSYSIDASFPKVTLAMLRDYLGGLTVLSEPEKEKWQLRGFFALPSNGEPDFSVSPSQILFVSLSREAQEYMDRYEHSPFIVVHDGDEAPDWISGSPYVDRALVLKKDRAYSYILFLIQEFFLNIMFWARRMDGIAHHSGSFQDLIDASDEVLENFIALSDSTNVLMAHSADHEAPEKLGQMLVSRGFYTSQMISALEIEEVSKNHMPKFVTSPDGSGGEIRVYFFPIRHRGTHFGYCMMACDRLPMTDGLRDYVQLFLDWTAQLCERVWRTEMETKNPVNMFFINILSGKEISPKYIDDHIHLLGLPDNPQYKLVLIKTPQHAQGDGVIPMLEAAKGLNDGRCIPFRYGGDLLALLYANGAEEGPFSLSAVTKDVHEIICGPFSTYAATSQVFERIEDLDLAYKQANLSCDFKDAIDREHSIAPDANPKSVYAFEDAIIYYLIDEKSESRFREFTFSNSFLDKIIARDKANGTNDFALLFVYLSCDCNISLTAKRLFMHRNTVIYHIDKIKETFLLDFSDKGTRDRCLVDYKIKFLSGSSPTD